MTDYLLTQFDVSYEVKPEGVYTFVTRKSDGAVKKFFNAGHKSSVHMEQLMKSVTDEQAESYWPRPRKQK